MEKYIAFLRAINVGKRRVKMEKLRTLFGELGFGEVESFIASGNIIFKTNTVREELEAAIETHLQDALGYDVTTMIRTQAEIEDALEVNPFEANEGETVFVGFLKQTPTDEMHDEVFELETPTDEFAFYENTIYWWCDGPSHKSKFSNAKLERKLDSPSTFRNVKTLDRMLKEVLR